MSNSIFEKIRTYEAKDVAALLVKIANEQTELGENPENHSVINEGITNLKLQKMLFFADAISLAITDKPLINEDFEAWSFGPVIKSIYNEYKAYNRNPISTPEIKNIDPDLLAFLSEVWKAFGKYSAFELVNIAHKTGSPWQKHFQEGQNNTIPKEEIKEYYKKFFTLKND